MSEQDRGDFRDGPSGPPGEGGFGRDGARRRRGRRGRGGRPQVPGQPFRPVQPFRPAGPSGPVGGDETDEGSSQARELANYERRQAQQQRGPWRGPGFRSTPSGPGFRPPPGGPGGGFRGAPRPFRPGGPPRMGAPRGPRPGGPGRTQRYQDIVRRATGGPRVQGIAAQEAGEPIAGPHAVLEALRAGRLLRRIFIAQERGVRSGAVSDLIREAGEKHIQFLFVDRKEVDRLSPTVEHQGVVAIAEGRAGVELDELLLHLDTLTEPALVLVIDSLQDPQNFGVLLRSAEGAGADGVVIPRHRQVGLTPAVARTSAGASEHLLIADVANLRQAIDALKEKGIWAVGTDDSGEMEWDEVDYRGPTAVVIGNEAEGIRRLVLEGCDQVVRVPMQGQVSSLNAAAAGTVILFEALRQRLRDAAPPTNVKRQERPAPVAQADVEEGTDDEIPSEDLFLDDETGAAEMGTADEAMGTADEDVAETASALTDQATPENISTPGDAIEPVSPGTDVAVDEDVVAAEERAVDEETVDEKPKRARKAPATKRPTRKKAAD